ncbi:MAG: outer membrane lipoprotein-sorting protein [Ectothiorhodospiraceae bacterium]|jgi:hypothetical protein|nr:outer membrane lipoprotein-sorting protein [Ectothiorhodospiraceae bacterium]
MKTLTYTFTAALLLVLSGFVAAETPQEKGRRIAVEAYERGTGFGDFTVSGRMILRSPQGQESTRGFRLSGIETGNGVQKNLLVFEWPPDIRDVALLTVNQPQVEDQQWLYLPALRRVKRISTANRTGSFAGSELSYEDFVTPEVDRFTYRWIGSEACPNLPEILCNVVERLPVDAYSGYRRQVVWLDEGEYRIHRIDYHDRRDERLKTLQLDGYERHEGRHWRPARMLMSNHQSGRSTELQWSDYRFGTGLNDEDFSVRALERTR